MSERKPKREPDFVYIDKSEYGSMYIWINKDLKSGRYFYSKWGDIDGASFWKLTRDGKKLLYRHRCWKTKCYSEWDNDISEEFLLGKLAELILLK